MLIAKFLRKNSPFALCSSLILLTSSVFANPAHPADPTSTTSSTSHSELASQEKNKHASITIFAAGDIADCKKKTASETMAAQTAKIIANGLAKNSDAYALTLGDNTYPIGKFEEFTDCYGPTWGQFKDRTFPSPGNHDYGVPLAAGYFNYFDAAAGPDRRGYYSKSLGQWRLLSLNSNLSGDAMRKQVEWLKEELQTHKAACTLAYWHHPVFSTGGHGNNPVMKEIWSLLNQANADLVLSGHDHHYERFTPLTAAGEIDEKNGIRSFVVGTGGASLSPMFLPKNITEFRSNEVFGVLKLQLREHDYDWEFIPVSGQSLVDKGHGSCH